MAEFIQDHKGAEDAQLDLLRRASVTERFALVRRMTQQTIQLSRRAIRRANPGASEREIEHLFLVLHYGRELAERVKQYLESRSR